MKKLFFTFLVICLFSAPAFCANLLPDIPAGTAEDYFNRGNQYRQTGNLDQAISDYTNAIRVYSKHAKAYYNRGNAYSKQGRLSEAIADYSKAVEIDPQYTEAYYNMGNTYEKMGKPAEAIASYTNAIKSSPKYAAAYCNRGNVYQAQGNLQQALDDYNKALEINPDFAGVYSNRGNIYQAKGNFKQAIADYDKAIALNPNFAGFYSNRGNIYQNQGMLKQAVADYNMALDKDPNDSVTYYNRGLAYYGLEEFEKSLADYSTAISKNPSMEAYDDFVKYFPQKRQADSRNIRAEIAQMFKDKLDLGAKVMAPVAAAPAAPFEIAAPPAITVPAQSDARDLAAAAESEIKETVDQWLTGWESGDMETYRSTYDPSGFRSRNMNLDQWIQYKTNVRNRSRNIQISISDLRISVQGDTAKAVFTQSYSSSLLKDKGTKTLEMKRIGGEWKIFREMM